MGSWNTILDLGSLQYAPWRIYTNAIARPVPASVEPYRPEMWSKEPQLTSITDYMNTEYFFDAILRIEHTNSRRITENPVQTGANISDHSFRMPARVMLEIGMSDVMASYEPYQWESGGVFAKSVNAYKKLRWLQDIGKPLILKTRLDNYYNMVIENIVAPDDYKTRYGLSVMVYLKQIITASVSTRTVSTDSHKTDTNKKGVAEALPPNDQQKKTVLKKVGG